MKTIIAGCRWIADYKVIEQAVRQSGFEITEVVSGGQFTYDEETRIYRGADFYGECWAKRNQIDCKIMPALWDEQGKKAGPLRNLRMAQYADALIAVWDGRSRGTKNMIQTAQKLQLHFFVYSLTFHTAPPSTYTIP